MALSEKDVQDIITRYDNGDGDTVAALAEAFSVSDQTIRYHLKKNGVTFAAAPKVETDEELGIGEEAAPSEINLDALMKDPKLAAAIQAAVEAKVNQMIGSALPQPSGKSAEYSALLDAMKRIVEVQAMQQPGYIKPIPADELDRRAAGYVEMKALLKQYQADNSPDAAPRYVLGSKLYDNAAAMLFDEGQEVRTFLPPAESFIPQNESARKVYAAFMVWIGGPTADIGDQVQEAMIASKQIPTIGDPVHAPRGAVEVVGTQRVDVAPKRVTGTITPEQHGTSLPKQAGLSAQPTGPIFVGT